MYVLQRRGGANQSETSGKIAPNENNIRGKKDNVGGNVNEIGGKSDSTVKNSPKDTRPKIPKFSPSPAKMDNFGGNEAQIPAKNEGKSGVFDTKQSQQQHGADLHNGNSKDAYKANPKLAFVHPSQYSGAGAVDELVCMYLCIHACMHVCMYVCMYFLLSIAALEQ